MKKKNNDDAFSNVENKKNSFVYLAAIHIGFDYQLVMFRYMYMYFGPKFLASMATSMICRTFFFTLTSFPLAMPINLSGLNATITMIIKISTCQTIA